MANRGPVPQPRKKITCHLQPLATRLLEEKIPKLPHDKRNRPLIGEYLSKLIVRDPFKGSRNSWQNSRMLRRRERRSQNRNSSRKIRPLRQSRRRNRRRRGFKRMKKGYGKRGERLWSVASYTTKTTMSRFIETNSKLALESANWLKIANLGRVRVTVRGFFGPWGYKEKALPGDADAATERLCSGEPGCAGSSGADHGTEVMFIN